MSNNEIRRSKRVKLVASVTAAFGLLSSALLLAEHDAGARTLTRSPAVSSPLVAPVAPLLPTAPVATPQLLPADASGAQALALGSQIASQGVAAARAVVANQTVSPQTASIICPVLLADRAQVVTSFAALILQFPGNAPQLIVQRTATLATIDQLLLLFGCPVPSGTAV